MNHTQKYANKKRSISLGNWIIYAVLLFSFPVLFGIYNDLYYEIPSVMASNNLARKYLLILPCGYLYLFLLYNTIIAASMKIRVNLNDTDQQRQKLNRYLETLDEAICDIQQHYQGYTNRVLKLKASLDESQTWVSQHNYLTSDDETSIYDPCASIVDPLFNGLLKVKLKECQRLNISPSLFIESMPNLKIELHRMFVQITGNLIDNAIEAASNSLEKQVEICCFKQESTLCFSVINSFANDFDPGKMFNEGYSCKGPNRGYGLSVVREYCHASRGVFAIETVIDGTRIMQNLIIQPSPPLRIPITGNSRHTLL